MDTVNKGLKKKSQNTIKDAVNARIVLIAVKKTHKYFSFKFIVCFAYSLLLFSRYPIARDDRLCTKAFGPTTVRMTCQPGDLLLVFGSMLPHGGVLCEQQQIAHSATQWQKNQAETVTETAVSVPTH